MKKEEIKVRIGGGLYDVTKINDNFIQYYRKGYMESDCRLWYEWNVSPTITTNKPPKIVVSNEKEK